MSLDAKLLVVGEAIIDVTLPSKKKQTNLRLGGVLHACRALWALRIPYDLAYLAPAYLDDHVCSFAQAHRCAYVFSIGTIFGCPNVILIPHPEEAHHQNYELLLRDEQVIKFNDSACSRLSNGRYTDLLYFPGNSHVDTLLEELGRSSSRLHIDWGNISKDIRILTQLRRPATTVFVSTSSDIFFSESGGSSDALCRSIIPALGEQLLLKENRGGGRLFDSSSGIHRIGAQLRPVVHSVGVGDCFDAAYVGLSRQFSSEIALAYAAFVSAEYASTIDPVEFEDGVKRTMKIDPEKVGDISGVSLAWEERSGINIYIAAADFSYRDRSLIDQVISTLEYHNFSPRLPVREHGQLGPEDDNSKRLEIFGKDMALLKLCDAVVAVYDSDDPGTLVEIGIAAGWNKPVILFDPYHRADNLMLTELPAARVSTLDELILEIFNLFNMLVRHD